MTGSAGTSRPGASGAAPTNSAKGHFDPAQFDAVLEMLQDAYRQPRQPPSDWAGPTPVLALGLPRSGKSLFEQMLSCHPDVHGGGELRVLGALTETLRERGGSALPYPACVAELTPELTQSLTETYSRALDERSTGARFLIDTQPTNVLHLGLAAAICPNATGDLLPAPATRSGVGVLRQGIR